MQIVAETNDEGVLLRLDGEMTIYTAAALKEGLCPHLTAKAVEIDLSGVSEVDSSGLQLLMLAKRELGRSGGVLRLSRHSPAMVEALELCRLSAYFGDPMLLSGGAGT